MIDRIKQDRARWCHTRTLRVLGKADPAHHNSDRAGRPALGGALLRPQFLRERQPPRKREAKYQAQGVPMGGIMPLLYGRTVSNALEQNARQAPRGSEAAARSAGMLGSRARQPRCAGYEPFYSR